MTDAMQVWGYTPKSSAGLLTVAALKKYDLIEDQGTGNSRQVRVSDLGRSVVTDERDSPRMPGVLRDLAFRPTIHQELYDRFGVPLPPESTLRWHLVNELKFGEAAARDVIREYKATLDFIGLTADDDMMSPISHETQPMPTPLATQPKAPVSSVRPATDAIAPGGYLLPVGPGRFAVLQGPFPVTEEGWTLMLSVLDAMKPGLVSTEKASSNDPGADE
ncbi:MAG TPA: hypothetical protein VKR79_10155 [Gaiellaceae bacterium]|nr:hypothetical protein [Gaiellaceae bacterium]